MIKLENISAPDPLDLPPAERWEPWKDDTHPQVFRGVVIEKYTKYSDYSDAERNFVDVLTDAGDQVWTLSGFATRVHDELAKVDPAIGDRIGVKFLGMVKRKKDGKPYPDLKVVNYTSPAASAVKFTQADEPVVSDIPSEFVPDEPSAANNRPSRSADAEPVDGEEVPF